MDILEISKRPTCIRIEGAQTAQPTGGYHESVLRAYMIVEKVKELLTMGTPASVILEMIDVMESVKYPEVNYFTVNASYSFATAANDDSASAGEVNGGG